ncbi:MAG: RNA polymerase sigma factor [Planctomycetota bacterium]
MPPERSQTELIQAVLGGNSAAWGEFYRNEYPRVYRLCYGFLVDTAEAEDVAQDAMLQIVDRLSTFDQSRRFDTWRNTVAANLCRDRLRRKASRKRAEEAAAEVEALRPPPRGSDPSEVISRSEILELLKSSLSSLTPREREVFVLRDLEGASSSEAAHVLEVSEGTIRSLLCLARRRLRTLLGPRLPEFAGCNGTKEDNHDG